MNNLNFSSLTAAIIIAQSGMDVKNGFQGTGCVVCLTIFSSKNFFSDSDMNGCESGSLYTKITLKQNKKSNEILVFSSIHFFDTYPKYKPYNSKTTENIKYTRPVSVCSHHKSRYEHT